MNVGLYWTARNILRVMLQTIWRARGIDAENVPMDGPLIIACNHVSYLDPPVLGSFAPRPISYMAKAELFRIPILGPGIAAVGTYPVDRNGSATSAIRRSLEVLKSGGCIGIFPEGTRNLDGSVEAHGGVALLASLSKAPVVPAAITGSGGASKLHQIKVVYGKPMRLPADRKATREDLAKFTDEIMSAIRALAESIGGNS